jgi:hypothetical protein
MEPVSHPVWRGLRRILGEENCAGRGDFPFCTAETVVAEDGAM